MQAWSPTWMPEPATRLAMTIEQWSALPEDEAGELVDGYLTEEEAPDPAHEAAVAWLKAPPSILVEVITPTPRDERRDRVEKMDEYAALGVPYYWLVDPALGSFELFALTSEGRYARTLAATEGRLTDVPGCPDLVIDLDELWLELERLSAE